MSRDYQTDTIVDLAAALAKAQGEMEHAVKGVTNTFFKSSYADMAAVLDAARPALTKNGLSIVQFIDTDEQGNITLITQLSHASGQWMRSWYPVKPVKADPQGLGSAVTYARRYAYCAMTSIAAGGDDDDGNDASGHNGGVPEPQRSAVNQPKPEYRPSDPVRPEKDQYVVPAPVLPDGSLDFDTFAAELESAVDGSKNVNEVSMWNRSNAKTLKVMQAERPDLFDAIGEKFRSMSAALQ